MPNGETYVLVSPALGGFIYDGELPRQASLLDLAEEAGDLDQVNELELQIQERFNKYRAESSNELIKVEAELSQTTEIVGARQDQVKRTTTNAPLRGTVKNIRMNTMDHRALMVG